MIRGRLLPLTKNGDNGTYAQVLPIVAIFAECGTRHPSDKNWGITADYPECCGFYGFGGFGGFGGFCGFYGFSGFSGFYGFCGFCGFYGKIPI